MDRHVMDCGNGKLISNFKLERYDNDIRFKYKCIIIEGGISDQCYTASTQWNEIDGNQSKSINYLDRHDVSCKDGYGLRKIQLKRNNDNIGYEYTCCGGEYDCTDSQTSNQDM